MSSRLLSNRVSSFAGAFNAKACVATALSVLLLAGCQKPAPAPEAQAPAKPEAAPAAPAAPAEPAKPATPSDTPELKIATVDGKAFDLSAHRGKWVVVNFWATWCKPCLKEMPALSALDTMREHIDVVGLAYEDTTPAEMQAFLKKHPVSYPIALVDVYDPPKDFETPRGLPMTYLMAPDGTVAKQFVGPVTAKEIESAIAAHGKAP